MVNAVALRYEVKLEDMVGFDLFYYHNAPRHKQSARFHAILYVACFLIIISYLGVNRYADPGYWMFSIPFYGVFLLGWFFLIKH